jgi:predicted MPP superfamily phosphohydrolase
MAREKGRLITRRRLLGAIAAGAAAGAVAYVDARFIEPRWLHVSHTEVRIPSLPPAWDGVRIAVWADLHSGHLLSDEFLAKVAAASDAARPDIVAFCGDIAGGGEPLDSPMMRTMAALRPAAKFAIMGNHDSVGTLRRVCEHAGIELLVNSASVLDRGGQKLAVVGIDDLWRGRPDFCAALADVPPDAARVALCHNPDLAEMVPHSAGSIDLMLCGHTHGGQICLPLIGPLVTASRRRKYASGLASGPRCPVYTSRGIGMGIVPLRFCCRPELPIITLRR